MGKQHRVSLARALKEKRRYSSYFTQMFVDWAYAIRSKDQVYETFKLFHAMVEMESGKLMKCIRTDNGGEYTGIFNQYCKSKGIRHTKSVPKIPQHNGVSERMNRTIVEKIQCMLSHAKLPRSFWGEAMCAAIQVINLSPTTVLEGGVPEEIWSGKKSSYKHLRVFGCRAFVHIPKDERSKLDNKSNQCSYLSFGDEKFSYKLYDPVSKTIVRSRDVVFMENQTIGDLGKELETQYDHLVDFDSDDEDTLDNKVATGNSHNNINDVVIEDHNIEGNDYENESGDTQQEVPVESQVPQNSLQPTPEIRTSTRTRIGSTRYSPNEYVLLSDGGEPMCYQEAIDREEKE
ncbi:hypothetical protein LIER_18799 [Lithospermum erythrorhizon]|uniref:Integrase catalytic domain-containing protein n=1 Tax=Lithospermum erythrorhizon TaxID=34254 RepID=A0AAV3QHN7_LITER